MPMTFPSLRPLRQLRGMSQRDLAEKAGLHRISVGRLERGVEQARPSTAAALAAALGCDEADLRAPFAGRESLQVEAALAHVEDLIEQSIEREHELRAALIHLKGLTDGPA